MKQSQVWYLAGMICMAPHMGYWFAIGMSTVLTACFVIWMFRGD